MCEKQLQLHSSGSGTFVLIIFINLHSFFNTITLHEENKGNAKRGVSPSLKI
jgi:hypothetical protein